MNRIKELRLEKGWTQDELGEKLCVKRAAISKYETGKIPLTDDTIKKLSEIFSVSIDFLLGNSDIRNYANSDSTIALHSDTPYEDLPDAARDEINNFIEYVRQKYKK